jgi:16S rRNA (guanine966-N2)-methyltransferase
VTRIIAGAAGGRRLRTLNGTSTRPTSDRVREALFSSLESTLGTLSGVRFLDLFAGSGAVGLEARSRGAVGVTLVESDSRAAALIRANATALGFPDVEVLETKAHRLAAAPPEGHPFDVAFLDPPYAVATAEVVGLVHALGRAGWFGPEAVVVVERGQHAEDITWPAEIEPVRSRKYGETMLWYGRARAP